MTAPTHVVIVGNPVDGFAYYGTDDLDIPADTFNDEWWAVELRRMPNDDDATPETGERSRALRRVQEEQGWTDTTLLLLILGAIDTGADPVEQAAEVARYENRVDDRPGVEYYFGYLPTDVE